MHREAKLRTWNIYDNSHRRHSSSSKSLTVSRRVSRLNLLQSYSVEIVTWLLFSYSRLTLREHSSESKISCRRASCFSQSLQSPGFFAKSASATRRVDEIEEPLALRVRRGQVFSTSAMPDVPFSLSQ